MEVDEQRIPSARLTWDEIRARFPDQFVCLVDLERHPGELGYRSARVIARGQTRREMCDRTPEFTDPNTVFAFRFTGTSRSPLIRPAVILDEEARAFFRLRR